MSPTALIISYLIAVALVIYIYAGFPVLLLLANKLRRRPIMRGPFSGTISVVTVGYNEARRWEAKIQSILNSDIADQICEIYIGSDGSDDHTAEVIQRLNDPRVKLVEFQSRRGKPAVINDLLPLCLGDLVVLTDARQELSIDGIRLLAEKFADPQVGVVSGELQFRTVGPTLAAADGIGFYWKYEKLIRKAESNFRSVPGATGAFYAIRRELYRPIPANTILDDVAIPMQIVEQGYRCVLASRAFAYDTPSQSTTQESVRKRRTITGNFQLMVLRPQWLLPWKNPIWWEFMSHKMGRLISPLCLAIIFATNLALINIPMFEVLFVAQICGYVAALVGWLYQWQGKRSQLFGPFLMFVSLNVTVIMAFMDAMRGQFHATWQRST